MILSHTRIAAESIEVGVKRRATEWHDQSRISSLKDEIIHYN
jgi:hypothetical protein